jgi:hypothetical protein
LELDVIKEEYVTAKCISEEEVWLTITFTPTVPHCSLATLIGEPVVHGVVILLDGWYVNDRVMHQSQVRKIFEF